MATNDDEANVDNADDDEADDDNADDDEAMVLPESDNKSKT